MPAIIRIVRMTFQPDQCSEFESLFDSVRQKILSMPGCSSLSLKRDASQSNVYYTLSHWDSEESLHAYRHSPLFQQTWALTKAMFADNPQAFSLLV